MKQLLVGSARHRTFVAVIGALALAAALWMVTAPVATAREMSPAEMLQSSMPANTSVASGSKAEVLNAVAIAVKKAPQAAAEIVRAAIAARKKFGPEIVAAAVRAIGPNRCELVARIVSAAIAEDPDNASKIMEAAIAAAPACRTQIERATTGGQNGRNGSRDGDSESGSSSEGNFDSAPANNNPPPGSAGGGGGGFNPEKQRCQVCHVDEKNGKRKTKSVDCDDVPRHLKHGDTEGACPVTPTQNS